MKPTINSRQILMPRVVPCDRHLPLLFLLAIAFISPSRAGAQDGWLFSASPPVVTRWDSQGFAFHFTNTSDKPLHGITLHTKKDDQDRSRVIIDTIAAHQTASVSALSDTTILGDVVSGATITCVDYSKPLKIQYP
jgi:hypothetical protein